MMKQYAQVSYRYLILCYRDLGNGSFCFVGVYAVPFRKESHISPTYSEVIVASCPTLSIMADKIPYIKTHCQGEKLTQYMYDIQMTVRTQKY